MPDPYFTQRLREPDLKEINAVSRATGFIELPGFKELIENEEYDSINKFYHELSQELYNARRNNYSLGLRVIEPEISIYADRIQMASQLFLEKDLPELSAISFKLFVNFCNILLSVALKHEIPLRGFANIGDNFRGSVYSDNIGRAPSEDTMVLADLLEVFSFDEIFPDGFGQKVIPPVNIPYFYGKDLAESMNQLSSLNEIGIFMPGNILDYPATEITIYSDALIETKVNGDQMYTCNWRNWMEEHPENYSLDEISENLKTLVNRTNGEGILWKRFLRRK